MLKLLNYPLVAYVQKPQRIAYITQVTGTLPCLEAVGEALPTTSATAAILSSDLGSSEAAEGSLWAAY